MVREGGRTRAGMCLLSRAVGFGCVGGKMERRLGAGAGGAGGAALGGVGIL